MCLSEVADHQEQQAGEAFCGSIKSFNSRRGFGFVSCKETAERFGRDVYLSKDEAMALAVEPAVGQAVSDTPADDKKAPPPVQEGDFCIFQVRLSTEGFPQAVQPQRIHRLHGKVTQAPSGMADGIITVTGDGSDGATKDDTLQQLLGAEVRVRNIECGQLQLLPNDEVAFCCANTSTATGPALEARLIELIHTSRAAGSLMGCFSLVLPQPPIRADDGSEHANPAVVHLSGYALTERVLLSEVPLELGSPGLMRLFKKIGGLESSVIPASRDSGLGFAYITFSGPESVAKFLAQATHTISETGITQLAYVGACPHRKSGGACHICSGTSTASGPSDVASECSTDSALNDSTFASRPTHAVACCQSQQNVNTQVFCEANTSMHTFTQPTSCPTSGPLLAAVPTAVVVTAQASPMPQAPPVVTFSNPPTWRCIHNNIVVPSVAPEVVPFGNQGSSIRIAWPTVIHASAYVIDLIDQATMQSQQFMHVTPEDSLPSVMEIQVDGLRPSVYAACIRCVASCGCESQCSPWSIMRVDWVQPAGPCPANTVLHMPPANAPTVPNVGLLACPPPPAAPPSLPLTVPPSAQTTILPPIPEEMCDMVGNGPDEILTLD